MKTIGPLLETSPRQEVAPSAIETLREYPEDAPLLPPRGCAPAPRILYADDEENLRRCLTVYLEAAGYTVTAVADGQQAWEALQSSAWDLLITDEQMPGQTGSELIARARRGGMELPIILVTGELQLLAADLQEELQLTALLHKPFGAGELFEAIDQALWARHHGSRLARS